MKQVISKKVFWIILDGMRSVKDGHVKARLDSFDDISRP